LFDVTPTRITSCNTVFGSGSTICPAIGPPESEYLFVDLRGPWAGEKLSYTLWHAAKKHLDVALKTLAWRRSAIEIATRRLMQPSKKKPEYPEDGIEEFAESDDDEKLELDIFRHIIVRQDECMNPGAY
jgi:hypothetical protein